MKRDRYFAPLDFCDVGSSSPQVTPATTPAATTPATTPAGTTVGKLVRHSTGRYFQQGRLNNRIESTN